MLLISIFLVMTCFSTIVFSQAQKSATVWFKSGKEKANNKDYYGAIEDYTKAIELNPAFAKAYNARGIAYLKYDKRSKSRSEVFRQKARSDLMKAKELGFPVEQKYLDECE